MKTRISRGVIWNNPGRVAYTLAMLVFVSGCNSNPVEQIDDRAVSLEFEVPVSSSVPTDILWVIDNSFSMCQEQQVLRDNFDRFAEELQETRLDFHIAVTTTHAPSSSINFEPVAIAGHLQSTPQPVPGLSRECIEGEGVFEGEETKFMPLRESLRAAGECMSEEAHEAHTHRWSDAQFQCALLSPSAQDSSGCVATHDLARHAGEDGVVTIDDLFPPADAYRPIPLVLRAEDYIAPNGKTDLARLRADFACMSLVGTRGDGYEKGLLAAVMAVSPELTGGALGAPGADPSRPNHGFLRQDARFSLVFVSDENDCSHDGSMPEQGNACGSSLCDYYNSSRLTEEETPLLTPESLAASLRENLAASKARALVEDELYVAGIYGTSKRFDGEFSQEMCAPGGAPRIEPLEPVCQSATGEASSGDRYERFIRQFRNHYPNSLVRASGEEARLDFSKFEPLGWMCSTSFAPALQSIGESIANGAQSCMSRELARACEADSDCPAPAFSESVGRCEVLVQGDRQRRCRSSFTLVLSPEEGAEIAYEDATENPFCLPESVGLLADREACVVDPSVYAFRHCAGGVAIDWVESDSVIARALSGYTLRVSAR